MPGESEEDSMSDRRATALFGGLCWVAAVISMWRVDCMTLYSESIFLYHSSKIINAHLQGMPSFF